MATHGCAGPTVIKESPLSFVTAVHLLGFGETGMQLYENSEVPFCQKNTPDEKPLRDFQRWPPPRAFSAYLVCLAISENLSETFCRRDKKPLRGFLTGRVFAFRIQHILIRS